MALRVVSFNGARLNSADSNTGWGNYNTGGGAPASEAANAYQKDSAASSAGSVGKKVNSTTSRIGVDYNGSNINYSGNGYMWYCKIYIADAFDLNDTYGVEVSIGSGDQSNYHEYNIAGSGANNDAFLTYPARGGYLIVAIDPTIDGWAEVADNSGTFDQTQVSWYAVAAQFKNGFAKAENVAMDAIDYGTGLTITNGDGLNPNGKFTDFYEWDQNSDDAVPANPQENRYGVVNGSGNSMVARGMLTIGDNSTTTQFTDSTTVVTFVDGYHSAGMFGVTCVLSTNNTIAINNTIIGEGRIYSGITDTRPDFIVTGEAGGTFTSSANLRNFRNITYNSFSTIDGADIECERLVQGGAEIKNSIIRGDRPAIASACVVNPTFGTTSGIHDTEFISATGLGHAIEFTTAGTYTLTNIFFTNYSTGFTSSSPILFSGTGTLTLNINGGDTPTYNAPAGGTVIINNAVAITVTVLDADTLNPIPDARVHLTAAAGGPLATGTVIYDGTVLANVTDSNGQISTTLNFTSNQPITGRARRATATDGTLYKQGTITGTITSNGFETTVILIKDE